MNRFERLLILFAGLALAGCSDSGDPGESDPVSHAVEITVTVPADAPTIYIAGNLPELGPWHPAAVEVPGSGTSRSVAISVPHGHMLRYKITAGSWEQEGLGPSGTLLPEFTVLVDDDKQVTAAIAGFRKDPAELIADWQGSGVEGELVYWKDVGSAFLDKSRHVVTWLPPGYDPDAERRYKVIYVQDGQNLFDPRLSYTNIDWGIDEAMMNGLKAGIFEPAIVVGIWNTVDRVYEYSPWHRGPQYARFMLEELMPRIESEFKVLTGPENTFAMGSSMGGLISFYLVKEHPDVFSACGCVSSHVTWSEQQIEWFMGRDPQGADPVPFILQSISAGDTVPAGVRLYFDYGTEGLDAAYEEPHNAVVDWLVAQGFEEGKDLQVKKFDGAAHSEASWRARVGEQLQWLLAYPDCCTPS